MLQLRQLKDPISTIVEVVSRLLLSIPSAAVDVNLLEEEIGWKGLTWGDIRPVQAMVPGVMAVCPPPHLHYPPNQVWATMAWVPMVGRPGQASCMPGWVTR